MTKDWMAPWASGEHCRLWPGSVPLLVSLPHDGSEIAPELAPRMQEAALASPDTDWHVARLYDFARELGAYVLRPRWSRYVIDLNRPPDGAALYPGRRETGLCPTQRFDGGAVYLPGAEPDAAEIAERVEHYWWPYHQTLRETVLALRAEHGHVLLWEGHSIRSHSPMFFDGRLPDYNLGTADGHSCAPAVQEAIARALADHGANHVINGRFKGGYITRHYGQPPHGVHAVQMEMAQSAYLDEREPERYEPALAREAQALLRTLLQASLAALPAR
ncbi:MAG: N-formylglutamate deformylase [Lysobacterales bacterium]